MASSAFSFHCMICFEEFDPLTNYPVVLPCGHTYVCIECANRLDKCMECREPLITKIEVPSTPSSSSLSSPANETIKENVATPSRYSYASSSTVSRRSYPNQQYNRGKYSQHQQHPPPQKTYITKRLPLPKNAVLLSLIQASEPARRRHAEEIQPDLPPVLPTSPSEEEAKNHPTNNATKVPQDSPKTVKFNKPSPLFLDSTTTISPVSVHFDDNHHGMHSMMLDPDDDEEHKIRVGTYLSGGPCGTYAVAAKTGLLVYPTLFEHSLQREEDGVSRDVENMVKNSYRNKFFSKNKGEGKKRGCGLPRSASCASSPGVGGMGISGGACASNNLDETAEITLGTYDADEMSEENVAVEAQFSSGMRCGGEGGGDAEDEESLRGEAMSDPGGSSLITSPTDMLALSTLRKGVGGGGKPLCPPRSFGNSTVETNADPALSATLKLRRQFSLGSGADSNLGAGDPDFDRSLIRLKYGDRVQVVSMDSRGWVKLARGYGYIRLENDKQLVKVGGTSDKACQIEAMLHELSLERNRLKHEQKKLEHLSAGLMIDLQCSLLTSDDTVIVQAPEGLALMVPGRVDRQTSNASKDDLDINTKSRTGGLTPIRPPPASTTTSTTETQPHEIRTVKSHSPGRNYSTFTPPSPPYNQTTPGGSAVSSYATTPTRVNFRTGLSGHRALSSSHSHPHDFIQPIGPSRSMSNHNGASLGSKKSSSFRGRSIY